MDHLTLAIRDLERSFDFYVTVLGCRPRAQWSSGAYLSLGNLWLCLSVDDNRTEDSPNDYTHYAFTINQGDFSKFVLHAHRHGVVEWKVNKSEGDSFYFLDPDGHKLEAHVGTLETRLNQCWEHPYYEMKFFK